MQRHQRAGLIFVHISCLLFAVSLILPCFFCEGEAQDWWPAVDGRLGIYVLLTGWIGVLAMEVPWLANPCWATAVTMVYGAWLFRQSDQPESIHDAGAAAFAFALPAFSLGGVFLFQKTTICAHVPLGDSANIVAYGPGYIVWMSSLTSLLIATIILMLTRTKS